MSENTGRARVSTDRTIPAGQTGASGIVGPTLALVAVVLVAAALRPGATSVGPVMAELRQQFGLGGAVGGLLTALPGLTFGAIGAVAVALSRRVGLTAGVLTGIALITVGFLLRTFTGSTVAFLACTLVGLAGMALGNVLVPAWIKRHGGGAVTRLMTAYSVTLLVGAAAASMLASPLARVAPGGWRAALGVWGLAAGAGLLPWAVLAVRERRDRNDRAGAPMLPPSGSLLRSPTAMALSLFFGMQALNAYAQFGWLPQIYRDAGLSAATAGGLLGFISLLGIVGGFLMPIWVARSTDLTAGIVGFGILTAGGYVGPWLAPATVPWLWAGLLGLGGWAFTAAIAMITARTRHPQVTARVSGFVQPVGYLMAGVGPLVVGVLYQLTRGWSAVLALLIGTVVVMTMAGLRLTRPASVDDEI